MKGYLLDVNVLVALLWPRHQHHVTAVRWFARHRAKRWATCAMTEAGFVRIVSNPAFSRDAVSPRDAGALLAANTASDDHVFWSCDTPFVATTLYAGHRLGSHQQVTDAYLLGLALARGGALATLDRGIQDLAVGAAERKALEIIT